MTKSCFLCSKKLGFLDVTFGKYTLSKEERSIPKGFGDEDVICPDCLHSQSKLEKPKREEPKPNKRLDMDEKPSETKFCGKCGSEISPSDSFCTNCGQKKIDVVTTNQGEQNHRKKISSTIWILPILLGFVGGLIMYFMVVDDDKDKAVQGLFMGTTLTALSGLIILIYTYG